MNTVIELFTNIQTYDDYNNPQSVTCEDFEDDMKRFKYLKRLLRKYEKSGVLRTHLILNHIIGFLYLQKALFSIWQFTNIRMKFFS